MTSLPLSGVRILVTRSRHQSGRLAEKLTGLGADVKETPVLSIGPPDSWAALDAAIAELSSYDWIVFASVNAVESFTRRLESTGKARADLESISIAAIGPATAAALQAVSLQPDFLPERFIAEGVVEGFPGYPNLSGTRILWPRSNVGRSYIADKLSEAGAVIDAPECYRSSLPDDWEQLADDLIRRLEQQDVDVITLASSQTASNLATMIKEGLRRAGRETAGGAVSSLLSPIEIACIGPETSRTARELLGKSDIEAKEYTTDGIVTALCRHYAPSAD